MTSSFEVRITGLFQQQSDRFPLAMASGAPLVNARPKSGLAMPRRGGYVHIPERMVVAWDGDRLRYVAKWKCGSHSMDAEIVAASVANLERRCALCADADLGPALYRFFGAQSELLYIGSAEKYLIRRGQHVAERHWWHEVMDESVERFPTLLQARIAETDAIRAEHPRYNDMRRLKVAA